MNVLNGFRLNIPNNYNGTNNNVLKSLCFPFTKYLTVYRYIYIDVPTSSGGELYLTRGSR